MFKTLLGVALGLVVACRDTPAHAEDVPQAAETPAQVQAEPSEYKPAQKPVRKARQTAMSSMASYYAKRFHGRKTSSGRHYDMHAMSAAHRTLPFGTWVKVTNRRNGRSVVVEITDRGPFAKNRVIDVSLAAANKLGMRKTGLAPVKLKVVPKPKRADKPKPVKKAVSVSSP